MCSKARLFIWSTMKRELQDPAAKPEFPKERAHSWSTGSLRISYQDPHPPLEDLPGGEPQRSHSSQESPDVGQNFNIFRSWEINKNLLIRKGAEMLNLQIWKYFILYGLLGFLITQHRFLWNDGTNENLINRKDSEIWNTRYPTPNSGRRVHQTIGRRKPLITLH